MIIEDQQETRLLYEKFLRDSAYHPIAVKNLREADEVLKATTPSAIVLDIILNGQDSWQWLAQLKNNGAMSQIPLIVATEVDDRRKGIVLGADAFFLKPLFREELLATLGRLTGRQPDASATSPYGDVGAGSADAHTPTVGPGLASVSDD